MSHRLYSAIVTAILLSAALSLAAAPARSPRTDDLTVHEWGTFTSIAGDDGMPVEWNALGCRDDLPRFVNDFGFRGFKFRLRGTVRMETPVMYFYSPTELDARVNVSFPGGVITEWYPRAQADIYQSSGHDSRRLDKTLSGLDLSLRNVTGVIDWELVHVQPRRMPRFPVEEESSRYYTARETDADPLTVGDDHEKFLFYRGVGRFPIPLAALESSGRNVLITNRGGKPVPFAMLFENRSGRLGFRRVSTTQESTAVEHPSLDATFASLQSELEAALGAAGLFAREARAMVETWKDSWFEEGMRLIYIVPAETVDRFLPLTIDPAPQRMSRVFVGRIELMASGEREKFRQCDSAQIPTGSSR